MSSPSDRTWISTADSEPDGASGVPAAPDGADRYEDREVLGQGGLGRVVATRDGRLDRVVARKELIRDSIAHRERFQREARITAGLEHPSIVPVYDTGTLPDGTPFYTMKQVDGRSLSEALAGARDRAQRLALLGAVLDVCQAVAYAHARGVVHRDLKPENVMLGRFGETWVVDWGLARSVDDPTPDDPTTDESPVTASGSRALTRVGAVVGTPGWMSPEQAAAQPIGPASDVWSLGAILYAVLVGEPPITAPTALEAVERAREGPVTPVALATEGVPPDLAAVVDKALAFRPQDRYPDAGALAAELQAWLDGQRVEAYRYSPWQVLRQELWRRRFPVALATALVGLLALAGFEADRRERAGNARAFAAERREREATAGALAGSLVAQGQQALDDRDLQLAGALGAVAVTYADLPEARGLAARALIAGPPARLGGIDLGWSCRWIDATADGRWVACGGDGLAVWSGDTQAWSVPGGGPVAISPDGEHLVAVDASRRAVTVRGLADGVVSREIPTGVDRIQAVGWAAGRPVWSEGGDVVAEDRRVTVCRSHITELRTWADTLQVSCVNGAWAALDPATLDRVGRDRYAASVTYSFVPMEGGAWIGSGQSIQWRSDAGEIGRRLDLGDYPSRLARSPDGRWLVVATVLGRATWIDLATGEAGMRMPVSTGGTGLAFLPDGTVWAGSDTGAGRWAPPSPPPPDLERDVTGIVLQADGTVLLETFGGELVWLDPVGGARRSVLHDHRSGSRVEGGPPGVVRRAAIAQGLRVQTLEPDGSVHAELLLPADATPGGPLGDRWLFARGRTTTLVLDRDLRTVAELQGTVAAVDGIPHRIVDGGLEVLDPATFEVVRPVRFRGSGEGARGAEWEAVAVVDGRWWLRFSAEPRFRVLDPDDGSVSPLWPEFTRNATSLLRLTDGSLLAGTWDGTWTIVDPTRGVPVAVLRDGGARAASALELPGGRLLTLDWDGRVVTWDLSVLDLPAEVLAERVLTATSSRWEDGRLVRQ